MAKEICPLLPSYFANVPWHAYLGVRIEELRRGYARLRLPYRNDFAGNVERGVLHGGVLASLADICAISTLWTYCQPEDLSSTVDLKVDYLRPAPLEDMIAEGEIRLRGHRIANVVVSICPASAPSKTVVEARTVCYTVPAPASGAI